MSTRSAIIIEEVTGSAKGIYVHFDGYPDHHKPILLNNYNSEQKVRDLINLGDLSSLKEQIGSKQDFQNPVKDTCLAYHRDNNEELNITHGLDWQKTANMIDHNGHVYVFKVTTNKWYYSGYYSNNILIPLEEVEELC